MFNKILTLAKEKFNEYYFAVLIAIVTLIFAIGATFIANAYVDIVSAKFINLAIFLTVTPLSSLAFKTVGFDVWDEIINKKNMPLATVEAAKVIAIALCTVL